MQIYHIMDQYQSKHHNLQLKCVLTLIKRVSALEKANQQCFFKMLQKKKLLKCL